MLKPRQASETRMPARITGASATRIVVPARIAATGRFQACPHELRTHREYLWWETRADGSIVFFVGDSDANYRFDPGSDWAPCGMEPSIEPSIECSIEHSIKPSWLRLDVMWVRLVVCAWGARCAHPHHCSGTTRSCTLI